MGPTPIQASVASVTSQPMDGAPTVNRKKQKRRQKQAAKVAAEHQATTAAIATQEGSNSNGHPLLSASPNSRAWSSNEAVDGSQDADEQYESRGEDLFYSDEESQPISAAATAPLSSANPKSKKKKKKSRGSGHTDEDPYYHPMPGSFHPPPPPPPPPPLDPAASASRKTKDRIWNTSTQEERERIKEFWLSLEESQRKSLVKVEKEAVLKKMKEQQRNSCSCTVCGRKRTAIEEELEVLYDAYYDELEHKPRGRLMEEIEDDEDEEDDDDEVYSDEDYDDDSYDDEPRGPAAADFLQFGNSLQVNGGILTVADDLLKNDGKKFIEMMEQLAERRMAREKGHSTRYDPSPIRPPLHNHDHPPLDDEEDYEDDDLDYDDSQDEEYDDEMEAMSEEQRMEEGRRMFQIFAARMFEQRVLTAYKEKVAAERQEKLLEELADESRLDAQREAKKAKEAQKKKDRKKQQKAAKEEERQRKEAEKAAEEAAVKAAEGKKLEEQRLKKEEQKRKKEAERKAQEDERLKKEAEKARKVQEAKAQQAEAERKLREQKEQERKRKDEAKRKEREEREAKEKDARDRKEKELAEKREREFKAKADREARERTKKGETSKQAAQTAPVPVPPLLRKPSAAIPTVPPGLQANTAGSASPHLPVATPALPKTTTPSKPRQSSTQGSLQSSPKTSHQQSGSSATSPGGSQPSYASNPAPLSAKLPSAISQVMPNTSLPPIGPPLGAHTQPVIPGPPGMPTPNYQSGYGPAPGMISRGHVHEAPGYSHQGYVGPNRGYQPAPGLGFPSGMNGMRGMPQGRGSPTDAPSQAPIGSANPSSWMPPQSASHSRQTSASYEKQTFEPLGPAPGAITRPTPIQRPGSIPHQHSGQDLEELSKQLGSSALLDDADDGPVVPPTDHRGMASGTHRPSRIGFDGIQNFPAPIGSAKMEPFSPRQMQGGNTWGAPHIPLNPLTTPTHPSWPSSAPGANWGNTSSSGFGVIGGPSRIQSRPVALRHLACQACKQLSTGSPVKGNGGANGFHHIDDLVRQMEIIRPASDPSVKHLELLNILDTEGDAHNGGGNFVVQNTAHGTFVKFEAEQQSGYGMRLGAAPGDIGSPVAGSAIPFGARGLAPTAPSGY